MIVEETFWSVVRATFCMLVGYVVLPIVVGKLCRKKNVFEVVRRFLVFPRRFDGRWRWLCWAYMWKQYNEGYSYMEDWATKGEYDVVQSMYLSTDVCEWNDEDYRKLKEVRGD